MQFKKYLKSKLLITIFEEKFSHKYSMGVDGITTEKFSEILDDEIDIIKRKITNKTYNISSYKEKLILKNRNSKPRMISIPTNRDRLTFSAVTEYLQDKFCDIIFDDSIHTMVLDIQNHIKQETYDSFIKIDVQNFYPSINHEILLKKLKKHIDDELAIPLIEKAIKTPTVSAGKRVTSQTKNMEIGVPQGVAFSNILSSIYMSDFDRKYLKKKNISYYRFVDDILILCNKKI